jgi:hypothetical protein
MQKLIGGCLPSSTKSSHKSIVYEGTSLVSHENSCQCSSANASCSFVVYLVGLVKEEKKNKPCSQVYHYKKTITDITNRGISRAENSLRRE